MKRPRKFLAFILILLTINTLFFVAWYAFDLQGKIKGVIEREAGAALKGKMQIRSLSFSDQQALAEGITFISHDGKLQFSLETARIRYNLLKFIFSGFRTRNLLNKVDIDHAVAKLRITGSEDKPSQKLEIPDLRQYFNDLTLTNSKLNLVLELPVKIGEMGMLTASEEFSEVELKIRNTKVSRAELSAVTARQGRISLTAILDKGMIASANAELSNYQPLALEHPDIRDLRTRINLSLEARQKTKDDPLEFYARALLEDTGARILGMYDASIPRLTLEATGDRVFAEFDRSTVGTSSLEGSVSLTGLGKDLRFQPSLMDLNLDLSMLDPNLAGMVAATLSAEGKASKPSLSLVANSPRLSYQGQTIRNVNLNADYADDLLDFTLLGVQWENQSADIVGVYNTKNRKVSASLTTVPLNYGFDELKVMATADLELTLYEKLPEVKATFSRLGVSKGNLDLQDLDGYVNLFPAHLGEQENYYVDLNLSSPTGTEVTVLGDVLDRNLLLDANFDSVNLAELYPLEMFDNYAPLVNGQLSSIITGSKAVLSSKLELSLNNGLNFRSGLDILGSYDLATQTGNIVIDTFNGLLNGQPLDMSLVSGIQNTKLTINTLNLNDRMFANGSVDLNQLSDLEFQLTVRDLSSELIAQYYPGLALPELRGMSLSATYNREQPEILSARFSMQEAKIPGFRPLGADLMFLGKPQQVEIYGGIRGENRRLVDLNGTVNLLDGLDLRLNVIGDRIAVSDVMSSTLAEGEVDCNVGIYLTDLLTNDKEFTFDAQIVSPHLFIPGVADLDDVLLRLVQTQEILIVDTLSVQVNQLASVNGSGSLDYNLLNGRYYEGNRILNLDIRGEIMSWFAQNVTWITESGGQTEIICKLSTYEDQFMVDSGSLSIRNGRFGVDSQPEPIRNMEVSARIEDNRLLLDSFTGFIGDGKLTVLNEFDEDQAEHLMIGFLDLGKLKFKVDAPGAPIHIPEYTAPRNISRGIFRGQGSEWATVSGPFDDMKIVAEMEVFNSEVVYPPETDNLLDLIYKVRTALDRPQDTNFDGIPQPLTIDLIIRSRENNKYTTYPANILVQPEGYIHVIFNGLIWEVQNADFYSEKGSIDFFGTVFQTERLDFDVISSQGLVKVEGTFKRKSVDGTEITLNLTTDPDQSKPLLERLVFSLSSDNPQDRTISSILSRLRYSSSTEELSATQQSNILQDEALNLISDNLNTSFVSPILYPIENYIRRALRLDDFSINAGFIQNLFTEYSNNPGQIGDYTDMDQFMSDIAAFSSSILLNNLSISASKYLGSKFFLDYTLTLQESTDLQNRTKIMVSHDTSLRWFLPQQFRLAYTFKYEPQDDRLSHEIMLQRSFRFWGLTNPLTKSAPLKL